MLISEYVRLKRAERGLTQKGLSDKSGLDRGYLSRLEKGDYKKPSITVLSKLANALEISITDLLRACDIDDLEIAPDKQISFSEFIVRKFNIRPEYPELDYELDELIVDFYESFYRHYARLPRAETRDEQRLKVDVARNFLFRAADDQLVTKEDGAKLLSGVLSLQRELEPAFWEKRKPLAFSKAEKAIDELVADLNTALAKNGHTRKEVTT